MPILFNNCGGRKYDTLYEEDNGTMAFFDLNTTGLQAKMATNLQRGDACVVAAYEDGDVIFKWYSFSHFSRQRNPDGTKTKVRVLSGESDQVKVKATCQSKGKDYRALSSLLQPPRTLQEAIRHLVGANNMAKKQCTPAQIARAKKQAEKLREDLKSATRVRIGPLANPTRTGQGIGWGNRAFIR